MSKPQVLIALDSFKGTFSSEFLGSKIKGLLDDISNCKWIAISDGGEGWVDAFHHNMKNTSIHSFLGFDSLLNKKLVRYTKTNDGRIFTSLSESCPIEFPLGNYKEKTTRSFGKMILEIFNRESNIKSFNIGFGGSSTIDLGMGALFEFGMRFLNKKGESIIPNFENYKNIVRVNYSPIDRFHKISFNLLTDVNNKLLGKQGGVQVFGNQKGFNGSELLYLEREFKRLLKVFQRDLNITGLEDTASLGAAGGAAFSFMASQNITYKFESGIEKMIELIGFSELTRKCDFLVLGEGAYDSQTAYGKAVSLLRKHSLAKKNILFCGIIQENEHAEKHFNSLIQLRQKGQSIETAIKLSRENLDKAIITLKGIVLKH